jgi:hypothetical protein
MTSIVPSRSSAAPYDRCDNASDDRRSSLKVKRRRDRSPRACCCHRRRLACAAIRCRLRRYRILNRYAFQFDPTKIRSLRRRGLPKGSALWS